MPYWETGAVRGADVGHLAAALTGL
jgi:hypothetical protein